MIFSLLFSLGYDLLPVVILLLFHEYSFTASMPVTTRLQAKRLISSSKEHSVSTSTNSPKGLSTSSQQTSSTKRLSSSWIDSIKELSCSSVAPSLLYLGSSSEVSTHDGSPPYFSTTVFQNLEFQNFKLIDAPSNMPLSVEVSSNLSHFLKMEADCEDNPNDLKMSPEMASIAKMIVIFLLRWPIRINLLKKGLSRMR